MEKEFEEFCRAVDDIGAKIELTSEKGKTSLRLQGASPMLFHGACEIVKRLAANEGKVHIGRDREYVQLICKTVMDELEEESQDVRL